MRWICVVCCFWLLTAFVQAAYHLNPVAKRTFIIDYEQNEFIKDGKVFRYVSGSLHYFRVPQPYWRDRIQKMKAAGLNAITSYVEWSLHEPFPGVYNFEGIADLEYFMQLIKEENMYLILRPGPYICAERDFGGFPYWLLNVVPTQSLRTNNTSYKKYILQWFKVLMPKVQPYLYGNGGNIIMVQVENEYGSYYACDSEYKRWLRDLFRIYVGDKAVLFTIDGCGQSYLDCGTIPEVFATVDFGTSNNAYKCFEIVKKANNNSGPLVNSEFYDGWLSHWQEPSPIVTSIDVVMQMKVMLMANSSFSFYMFHGGTNFGFTSGANTNDSTDKVGYLPQLTSYDYNAPLDEAGDPTEKYFMIKQTLEDSNHAVTNDISPAPAPKGAYGTFVLQPLISVFDKAAQRLKPVTNSVPLSFEDMDINTGFVMYETMLTDIQKNVAMNLTLKTVRDRAIVYLNHVQMGIMSRLKGNTTLTLNFNSDSDQQLSIFIENQGRINYGDFLEDRKGIFERVILGNQVLGPWTMTAHPLNETSWLSPIEPVENVQLPAFYRTQFTLPANYTKCLDTYLDTTGWSKGVAFLNEINLGRYWPVGGPQVTLYVPGTFLLPSPSVNTLVMFELENAPHNLTIKFIDKPIINGPVRDT